MARLRAEIERRGGRLESRKAGPTFRQRWAAKPWCAALATCLNRKVITIDLGNIEGIDELLLARVAPYGETEALDLAGTLVTDAGLARLGHWRNIRRLDLSRTRVTGSGLACLGRCRELSALDLSGCPLKTEALRPLSGASKLAWLDLSETTFSP